MTFAEILVELNNGKVVTRESYNGNFVIFKQIPCDIENVIPMKSLPSDMKILLKMNNLGIKYRDQYIIYDYNTEIATYTVFDGEDINATDWLVINPVEYNFYE